MESNENGAPENGEDWRPALITCPQCGHPNLEFRNHCRRCGGRLRGSANLIPGADLVEWTATDGRARFGLKRPPGPVLAVLVALFAIVGAALFAPASMRLIAAVALVSAFGLLGYSLLINRDLSRAGVSDEGDGTATPERQCPGCGASICAIDDICPVCGEIVGEADE
ncbi:MAG: hypothetical protein JXR94_19720 [Candidatus Hydrogenedentes bacterium]|nr:hypothetical protein [Candidatus Hydrogenedentota bacterium]